MKKITTVILAAGNSSRFRHPKSKIFQDLAGLPIIDHVYRIANKISPKNVIFVCNKNNIEDLKNKFLNAKFVIQNQQRGTADAISCAKKYLKDSNILILFADVPLITLGSIKRLIKNFYKNNSRGSMIAFKAKNSYGYGRVKIQKNFVTSVVEDLSASESERKINLCNSGVMLCNSRLLFNNINKISNNNIKKEKYLPDIFSIFNNLNLSFSYVLGSEDEMLGVNTIQDLIDLETIFQKKIKDKIIKGGVILQNPESIHLSYDTVIKKGSNIEPFVFIKTGVSIKNNVIIKSHSILEKCKINSFSSIGPSARIRPLTNIGKNVKIGNFVEVKNSIIGDSTSISHLSYIGDSKLGKYINIGAGTITCNYDGSRKNRTIINDNVFVGSNCSLVAPITIGKNSTIGAGSVITKNIPKNHLALERTEIRILKKHRKFRKK